MHFWGGGKKCTKVNLMNNSQEIYYRNSIEINVQSTRNTRGYQKVRRLVR